ncbi:MAG TPA: hypothetical protein DDY39_05780, partial [Nitrospira sp.]|nr:hypothetical protein [Nitrospira sp.]
EVSALALDRLAKLTVLPTYLPARFRAIAQGDDTQVVQGLFTFVQEEELRGLCLDYQKMLPIRRFFEPQWEHCLPRKTDRVERLSALATEANVRMMLANDFLFKVDLASMKESLEVRVPMLDEELFSFGLTLP